MQGDTIVFFPKYTTLFGHATAGGIFYSDPYDVTGYNQIDLQVFLDSEGVAGSFDAILQESSDLETWTPVAGASKPSDGPHPPNGTTFGMITVKFSAGRLSRRGWRPRRAV